MGIKFPLKPSELLYWYVATDAWNVAKEYCCSHVWSLLSASWDVVSLIEVLCMPRDAMWMFIGLSCFRNILVCLKLCFCLDFSLFSVTRRDCHRCLRMKNAMMPWKNVDRLQLWQHRVGYGKNLHLSSAHLTTPN